jgi:hypothetical protein
MVLVLIYPGNHDVRSKANAERHKRRTSGFGGFGLAFMASYFPSATASVPDDDPSTNSIGGGRRLLKVSMSLDGR